VAYLQRRCARRGCRKPLAPRARRCPACGGDVEYRARYRDPEGVERCKTFDQRVDAETFLTTIEGSKLRGEWIDPRRARTSLEEWTEHWLQTTVHLKPKTRAGYESLLRIHILPAFGKTPLGAIEPDDVSSWVAEMSKRGLSASRIRQAYRVLSAVLKAAVVSRYIVTSPCIGVRLPRPPRREMHFLSAEQVEALAAATPKPFDVMLTVMAYGGLRWGEVTALRRARCDLLRSRIEVAESLAQVGGEFHFGPTKTYETRSVRLPAFLRDMMALHLADNVRQEPTALVFTQVDGSPLRHWWFWHRIWGPAVAASGVPTELRIHDLRHTCTALLIAQGAHPKAIQVHLGHSTIQVTMDRYGHLFPDEMDRLADGLDMVHRAAVSRASRSDIGAVVLPLSESHRRRGRKAPKKSR
jgi:integrase